MSDFYLVYRTPVYYIGLLLSMSDSYLVYRTPIFTILSCNWSKAEKHHIDECQNLISTSLPCLPPDMEQCCVPDCSKHIDTLESYSYEFIKCIIDSAIHTIPCHSRPPGRTLAGWHHGPRHLRLQANFWYRVWVEAGCPPNGVLFQIKKKSKSRFKYAVRKIRRQQKDMEKKGHG